MADMPAPLQSAKIVAYFSSILPDADVGDSPPDVVPIIGTVVIVPNLTPKIIRGIGTTPHRIMTMTQFSCTINSSGEMYGPDGEPGVNVLASNSAGVSPTFQYRATIVLNGISAADQPLPILFNANAGTTTNLADVVSVNQPAIQTVVTEDSRIAAEAAVATIKRGIAGGVAALDNNGFVINADGSFPSATGTTTPNATATVIGKIQLAGDLTGTAQLPRIAASVFNNLALTGTPTAPTAPNGTQSTQLATTLFVANAIALSGGGGGGGTAAPDATSGVNGLIRLAGDLSGTAIAPVIKNDVILNGAPTLAGSPGPTDNTLRIPSTSWVNAAVAAAITAAGGGGAATPDATTTVKGKIQLAGDLGGTAASPTVPGLANLAPKANPTFTGTGSFVNITVQGTISIPDGSIALAKLVGLDAALLANRGGNAWMITGNVPRVYPGTSTALPSALSGTKVIWVTVGDTQEPDQFDFNGDLWLNET